MTKECLTVLKFREIKKDSVCSKKSITSDSQLLNNHESVICLESPRNQVPVFPVVLRTLDNNQLVPNAYWRILLPRWP